MLGVAELAALSGEAAGSERVHSVGIGQAKPPEQLAPATHELLTQEQLRQCLDLARDTADVFEVPGRQG